MNVRVGLIGVGFMGELHARGYHLAPRLSLRDASGEQPLVAVADLDGTRTKAFAERWRVERWTSDWQSLIGDPSIGVIDICTPPALHHEIAAAAIEQGKHVYCEKPVGLAAEETADLVERASERGVKTYVGFNYRWIPAVALAKQIVESGRLGTVTAVDITFTSDWAADPEAPWDWRFSAGEAGLGALGDVGSHVFDLARHLVGELVEVCGITGTFIDRRPNGDGVRSVDTDDAWAALGRFEGGAIGSFRGSRIAPGRAVTLDVELTGSRGSIAWQLQRMNELDLFEPAGDELGGFRTIRLGPAHPLHGDFSPVPGLGIGFADSKIAEIGNLLTSLKRSETPQPSFEDALAVARILDAAHDQGWRAVGALTSGASRG